MQCEEVKQLRHKRVQDTIKIEDLERANEKMLEDYNQMEISLVGLNAELEDAKEDHLQERRNADSLREKIKLLTEKINSYDVRYKIEQPKVTIKNTKRLISMCDEFTISTLIKYIDLDNYELIKNLADITNKDNVSDVTNYLNGWLARNFALKELLLWNTKKTVEFVDKIKNEVRNEKKVPKKKKL